MKKIIDVFASYCDCYIEYMNNFIKVDYFCEYYNIDKNEFNRLAKVVKEKIKRYNLPFCAIDYYINLENNKGKITFENE